MVRFALIDTSGALTCDGSFGGMACRFGDAAARVFLRFCSKPTLTQLTLARAAWSHASLSRRALAARALTLSFDA